VLFKPERTLLLFLKCMSIVGDVCGAWALTPTLVLCYFLAGAAGVAGAVTAGLAAGAGAFDGFNKL